MYAVPIPRPKLRTWDSAPFWRGWMILSPIWRRLLVVETRASLMRDQWWTRHNTNLFQNKADCLKWWTDVRIIYLISSFQEIIKIEQSITLKISICPFGYTKHAKPQSYATLYFYINGWFWSHECIHWEGYVVESMLHSEANEQE